MPPKLSPDDSLRYLVQIGDQTRGPLTLDGLESLVYLGQITPTTPVREVSAAEFRPIKDTPLRETLFPKFVEQTGPAGWGKPGRPEGTSAPPAYSRQQFKFGAAKFERVNTDPGLGPKVDVTTLLDGVRRMERDAGLDEVRPERFKVSRRTKDFWIMLVIGNALLLGGGIAMQSLTSLVFAIGGMGLFTFGLLWSMYGVMGKY